MLKPSLQLRLGQQLTMTPQLQQAIKLLQLPVMDLQTHIREVLESNVMLEAEESDRAIDEPETTAAEAEEAALEERARSLEHWIAEKRRQCHQERGHKAAAVARLHGVAATVLYGGLSVLLWRWWRKRSVGAAAWAVGQELRSTELNRAAKSHLDDHQQSDRLARRLRAAL